jgi:hypothetical protein
MIFIRNTCRLCRYSDVNDKYFFDLARKILVFRAASPGLGGHQRQRDNRSGPGAAFLPFLLCALRCRVRELSAGRRTWEQSARATSNAGAGDAQVSIRDWMSDHRQGAVAAGRAAAWPDWAGDRGAGWPDWAGERGAGCPDRAAAGAPRPCCPRWPPGARVPCPRPRRPAGTAALLGATSVARPSERGVPGRSEIRARSSARVRADRAAPTRMSSSASVSRPSPAAAQTMSTTVSRSASDARSWAPRTGGVFG